MSAGTISRERIRDRSEGDYYLIPDFILFCASLQIFSFSFTFHYCYFFLRGSGLLYIELVIVLSSYGTDDGRMGGLV